MKSFTCPAVLAALAMPIWILGQQQPPSSGGEVIGIIQWETAVADLDKAEQFYHELMGIEGIAGDPRVRLAIGWNRVAPMLNDLYAVHGDVMNFYLRVPGSDMGIEPIRWSEAKGKLLPSRIQDPGAAHLVLHTWNIDAMMARIAKSDVQVLTAGGKPVTVAGPNGNRRVVWLREPNGFFVQLVETDPSARAPGSFNPATSFYTGAHAGFTVEDMQKTVGFFRDVLGFQVEAGGFLSNKDQLAAFGVGDGQYRMSILHTPGDTPQIDLIEFKGVERKPLQMHVVDPNALVLRLRVRGLDALAAKLKAAGTKIVSVSGKPFTAGPTHWMMVEGPDNIFLQLAEAPDNMPNPGAPLPPSK